jgi:hypothetical protein
MPANRLEEIDFREGFHSESLRGWCLLDFPTPMSLTWHDVDVLTGVQVMQIIWTVESPA